MKRIMKQTAEQTLQSALIYAQIENDDPQCLFSNCSCGLYHFIVETLYLKYEFYVDSEDSTILGIQTEPLPYFESLHFCESNDEISSAVA